MASLTLFEVKAPDQWFKEMDERFYNEVKTNGTFAGVTKIVNGMTADEFVKWYESTDDITEK